MVRKILSVYEEWFAEFLLPEGFEEAQEAHEVEHGFNLLDWPCENLDSIFLWFVDSECFIKNVYEEEAEKEIEELILKWMFKQF